MLAPLRHSRGLSAMLAASAVLLGVLATLQYHWLGEVSRAERDRMQASLASAGSKLGLELDGELTRAFLHFQPGGPTLAVGTEYSRLLALWQQTAPYPELVQAILLVQSGADGRWKAAELQPEDGSFLPLAWPPELEPLQQSLAPPTGMSRWRGPGSRDPGRLLDSEVPALIIPLLSGPGPMRPPHGRGRRPFVTGFIVVRLDAAFLRQELLPELARRYLQPGNGLDYRMAVVSRDTGALIWSSEPDRSRVDLSQPDLTVPLFGFLPPEELGRMWRSTRSLELLSGAARSEQMERPHLGRRLVPPLLAGLEGRSEGAWLLLIKHPEGSLEAAVTRARRRNVAIGSGVLLLLGATVVMLLVSTRRAQRLAAQQLEFVASISHELRTPLAAIRSLGENLSDGVVTTDDKIRSYGAMIEREGHRLTRLVEQTLELAGIFSEKKSYRWQPVAINDIVRRAIAESRGPLEEHSCRLEVTLPPDSPTVMADPEALDRALKNLIENAVKYAADGAWIGIRVETREGPEGPEVVLAVADRGCGIPADELARVFEPFYRGREAAGGQVAGSGLGLHLVQRTVEAHGGRVDVRSREGEGSTFRVHLPASREDA